MTSPDTDAAAATAHLLSVAGKPATVNGKGCTMFVDPGTIEINDTPGGKRYTASFTGIISKDEFPEAPPLNAKVDDNRGGRFHIQSIEEAAGLWELTIVRSNARS